MKKMFRAMSFILMVLVLISAFTACSDKSSEISTGGSYTYWVSLDNSVAQTQKSFNDLLMFKEMEKATGTKVNFIHPAQGTTGTESFQILMASGDYPDMMEYSWKKYTGGPDQAIADGVIISLNDYLEDYAPNYYNYMEGEAAKENGYLYKASGISDAGNYYGFKNLNIGRYKGFEGLYVRKDLIDKWGLDIPETIDDWEKIFETSKKNGIKYPLTGRLNIMGSDVENSFNNAWKVGTGFYVDNGKVKYGPFEKAFKDYLKTMRDWVEKGYVDIDYVTNDDTIVHGQITNGTSIASYGYVGGDLGKILPAMAERDPEFDLVACPFPVMKKGDKPIFQAIQADASDPCIAISKQCGENNEDRYKEAVKWCDYLYSDEGIVLKSFGVEGETFTIEKDENGEEHYIYTDKITDYKKIGATNIGAALYHYFLPANHPGFNQHPDYFRGYYPYEQQKNAIEEWNKYVDIAQENVFPEVSYTGEESERKANIESAAKLDLQATVSNIILGKTPLEEFDVAIEKAKKAGYDELIKINQAAYDRFAKLK